MNFTRGDTYEFSFTRKDASGNVITTKADQVYFTVKETWDTKTKLIQKKLNDGITFSNGKYTVKIENEDTRNLNYATYCYDIKVITNTYVKTIAKGDLVLEHGATFEYE